MCGNDCVHWTKLSSVNAGFDLYEDEQENDSRRNGRADASDFIVDMREYDVPYHVRISIDKSQPQT